MVYAFLYVDKDGVKSERHVNVDTIGRDHVTGYCRLRRCRRTFRKDRIVRSEMVVVETGEIVDVMTGEVR